MVTIPEIRKEILNAKREGNKEKSLILTTFLENAQKIAKEDKNREMTDQDLVAGVKREIKMAEQSKAAGAPYSELVFQLGASFLPKQMTERELRVTIEAIVSDLDKPNMGAIMKELKTFGDSVDMKAANVIIKEILG
jgi:uncharacterized protein YqeY